VTAARGPILELGWPQVIGMSRFLQFGVRVRIDPGVVALSTSVVHNRLEIRHTAREVVLSSARLVPPGLGWRSQFTFLGEHGEKAQVAIWWGLGRMTTALQDAGFEIEQHRTLIPPPGNWPPLSTRAVFRRRP
jgi:hypothetical protein